jgi:hypothetical protein
MKDYQKCLRIQLPQILTHYPKNQRSLASALCRWERLLQKHFHDNIEAQSVMFFLHIATHTEPVDLTCIGQEIGLSKAGYHT